MKNQLFNIARSLVVGSLVAFSSEALALPYNNQGATNTDPLTKCEFLVAQISIDETASIKKALTQCSTTLDNALSIARTSAVPKKDLIISKLNTAKKLTDDALSKVQSESIAVEDAKALGEAIEKKCSLVSELKTLTKGTFLAKAIDEVQAACCDDINIQLQVEVRSSS